MMGKLVLMLYIFLHKHEQPLTSGAGFTSSIFPISNALCIPINYLLSKATGTRKLSSNYQFFPLVNYVAFKCQEYLFMHLAIRELGCMKILLCHWKCVWGETAALSYEGTLKSASRVELEVVQFGGKGFEIHEIHEMRASSKWS